METLLSIFFVMLFLAMSGTMVYRVYRGEPLLSVVNFFLVGFLIFQVSSAAIMLGMKQYGETQVSSPQGTGVVYAAMVCVFLAIFAIGWKTRALTFGLQNRLGTARAIPSSATMMTLAWGVFGMACLFRFVLAFVPVFSALALIIAAALASASVGLGAWAWARHWKNPVFITLFAVLLVACVGVVMYQNFGRRDTASVLTAAVWGAFHGHFKTISLRRAFVPFVGISLVGIITLGALTASRTEKAAQISFAETITRLLTADVTRGLLDMAGGQEAAGYSMYLIESRPESMPYDTLHSLYYAASSPVPRIFWEDKPLPLGLTMVPEMGITRKSPGYNVGPGIIGHVVNDNPYIALWLYPLVLAALLRIADDLVKRFADNPFMVVPLGVALAEIIALSRGELGLFLFRTITATVSAFLVLALVAKVLVALGMRYQTASAEELAAGGGAFATDDEGWQHGPEELVDPEAAMQYVQDDEGRGETREV